MRFYCYRYVSKFVEFPYYEKAPLPFSYSLIICHSYFLLSIRGWAGHFWAQPNITHLRELMRLAYTHPEEAKKKGKIARENMKEFYSLDVLGQELNKNIERILSSDKFNLKR